MYSLQPHEAEKAQQNINTIYDAILQILEKLGFKEKERAPLEEQQEPQPLSAELEPKVLPQLTAIPKQEALPSQDYRLLPGNDEIKILIGDTQIAGTLDALKEGLTALPEAKLLYLHDAIHRPALPSGEEEVEAPDLDIIDAEIIRVEFNGELQFYQNEQGEIELNELEVKPQEDKTPQFQVVSLAQAEGLIQQNPGDSYQAHPELVSQMPTLVAAVDESGHLQATPLLQGTVESTVREVEAQEIDLAEMASGDKMMRTGEQLTQEDRTAIDTLRQIFAHPEMQGKHEVNGKNLLLIHDGDKLSVLAKDGRGEILSVNGSTIESRLQPQDIAAFQQAQQLLQRNAALVQAPQRQDIELDN